jgi:hypothetical protein
VNADGDNRMTVGDVTWRCCLGKRARTKASVSWLGRLVVVMVMEG